MISKEDLILKIEKEFQIDEIKAIKFIEYISDYFRRGYFYGSAINKKGFMASLKKVLVHEGLEYPNTLTERDINEMNDFDPFR